MARNQLRDSLNINLLRELEAATDQIAYGIALDRRYYEMDRLADDTDWAFQDWCDKQAEIAQEIVDEVAIACIEIDDSN